MSYYLKPCQTFLRMCFISASGGAEAFWDKGREAPSLPGTARVFTPEAAAHRGHGRWGPHHET